MAFRVASRTPVRPLQVVPRTPMLGAFFWTGKKKEHKLKLFEYGNLPVDWGSSRGGVGAKKLGMSPKPRENKLFGCISRTFSWGARKV